MDNVEEKPQPKKRGPKPGFKRAPKPQPRPVKVQPEVARLLIDDLEKVATSIRGTRDALRPWLKMADGETKIDAPMLLLLGPPMDWTGQAHARCMQVLDFLRGELEETT